MDIWVVSSYWLLQIKLPRTFVYKSLYGHMLSFVLDKYLGEEWLDYITGICLNYEILNCFPKSVYRTTFYLQCMRVPLAPDPHQYLVWSGFLISVILIGM